MRLRTALNDYKRDRDGRFREECPTAAGALSGHGDRLVYVDPDGTIRDYSSPLSGLYGIDRSRFGIETADRTYWFDDLDPVRQHYYRETNLVETEYDAGGFTVHQYDLTLGRAHVTHVELRGAIPRDAHLTAFLTLAPEGRETKVGRLIHESGGPGDTKAVEVFHRSEHDYVTASTGLDDVRGQIPERFDEILDDRGYEFPREAVLERYEDTHLSGDVVVSAPLERKGRGAQTTLVSQLSNHEEVTREEALADLRHCATAHATADDLRAAARDRAEVAVPETAPRAQLVREDLRVLALLSGPTGARIAGPEFDPFYAHSGGYGYAWFRDNAEIDRYLLSADDYLGLDATDRLARNARYYCDTQEDDGTWPHRAWAVDGSLAPGWANARVEGSDKPEYQADQTASVAAFLATLLRERRDLLDDGLVADLRHALEAAVGGLDDSLADDGLPVECQNAWENMVGRFVHTAATFLHAYAAVARAPVPDRVRDHCAAQAERVHEAIEAELWVDSRNCYALRLRDGDVDDRLDAGSFALVDAVAEYDALADDGVDDDALDRLAKHMDVALGGLYRETDATAGLIRFEEDYWRTDDQRGEKIWSVSTAWGANAAGELGRLLVAHGREEAGESYLERAGELYELLGSGSEGGLATDAGYLPEQVFDDGRPDSATPLGWSHALRLNATGLLQATDSLPSAKPAPSGPESRPRWTTGEKYGVGTVADHRREDPSRVWFTLTEGALTEVRFPRVDLMNLRTMDLLVVDADERSAYTARTYNETRRDDDTDTVERRVEAVDDESLSYRHVVTETGDGRGHAWELSAEYATDPEHDALLVDVSFEADDDNDYEVYAVCDTALTNTGQRDRGLRLGQSGSYHLVARDAAAYDEGRADEPLLIDEDGEPYSVAVAFTSTARFEWATADVAGSRALGDLFAEGVLPESNERVDDENVVFVGRLGTGDSLAETIALGFAENADTAAALGEAAGALTRGFETVHAAYADSWADYLADKELPASVADDEDLAAQYRAALMCLVAVEDKSFLGASIASPSVPWGEAVAAEESKGYGYNFVWSRDLYQVFTAHDLVGDVETTIDQLEYVYRYQQDDGGFIPQNTYLNGRTRWGGEQMDNISFPAVMAYHLHQRGIGFDDVDYDYDNLKRSADYVARNGPPTAQERWEEEAGYSPSSIAAEIAGLTCAAAVADEEGHHADALVWQALADDWAGRVEEWCATETGTARHTATPYYVRITRDGDPDAGNLRTLANSGPTLDEREIIDAGFLELTRLGIKPPDDETIVNSVAEVDDTIGVETPHGPGFYRYNGDGYGERAVDEEGAPWSIDAKGKGRLWPIFTGERGEYELQAGTDSGEFAPANLLATMAGFANSGRMIPEQVWDRRHATAFNWEFGEGTGAATPLAWSMAQFVRLAHGIDAGEPAETPPVLRERYAEGDRPAAPDLRVTTRFDGDHLRVTGETDGATVAVKTTYECALVDPDPDDGAFAVRMPIAHGENQVVVAAASDEDLSAAGTTVDRFTL